MQSILIKCYALISMDEDIGDVTNADILVEDGKIVKRAGALVYDDLGQRKDMLAESGRRLLHDWRNADG